MDAILYCRHREYLRRTEFSYIAKESVILDRLSETDGGFHG